MSNQVIASPEHMRDFARHLQQSATQITELMVALNSRFSSLGDTWRDSHYDQFRDAFEQAARSLNPFLDASERYVSYLLKKSEVLDRYGEIKVP